MAFNESHTNHFGDRATVSFRITIVPDAPGASASEAAAVAPAAHASGSRAGAAEAVREGGR